MRYIDKATGRFLPSEKKELSQELLKELFEYKDGFLYRKTSPTYNAKSGSVAGFTHKTGYHYVTIYNKQYKLHRLVFLYHQGYIPDFIDHKDNDPLNNKIDNLRACDRSQNGANRRNTKNRILPKGVTKNGENFGARIRVKGKLYWLGTYPTVELAKECYDCAAELSFGEFARSV